MTVPHVAFLASRMDTTFGDLVRLRTQVHHLGDELRRPVWVAEHAAPTLNGRPDAEVWAACLQAVRSADEFICVLNGSYGRPLPAAELCVLELEILMAAIARKPFRLFKIAPYEADHQSETLLRAVHTAVPDVVVGQAATAVEILDQLRAAWTRPPPLAPPRRRRMASSAVARRLRDFVAPSPSSPRIDTRFLDGKFAPLSPGLPNRQLVDDLLARADREQSAPVRLVVTWMAIRHLCAAPYNDNRFADFLPLWDLALSKWASAAAWAGLHGHHHLGRLAAVNTLLHIRGRMAQEGLNHSGGSVQGTLGARASEIYSMAKSHPSPRVRSALLRTALRDVNTALSDPDHRADVSGLHGIRGSILQAMGRLYDGLRDYRTMLRWRKAAGEGPGRIGEAEVELGMGFLRVGRVWEARRLMLRGIERLERSDRHEFTVRALRKLGVLHLVTFRLSMARRAMERAHDLAEARELWDQTRQTQPWLVRLRATDRVLGRFGALPGSYGRCVLRRTAGTGSPLAKDSCQA